MNALTTKDTESNELITAQTESADPVESTEKSETYQTNKALILQRLEATEGSFSPFGKANFLNERYEIDINQELEQFSKSTAKAYRVVDHEMPGRACIGYIMEYYHPHRYLILEKLQDQPAHPHLIELLGAGVINISAWKANRFVIVYEQPVGAPLSELIAKQEFFKASELLKKIIIPIAFVLKKLDDLDISHGSIHPDNVYYDGTRILLGDCIAEASNSNALPIYRPIEYLTAMEHLSGGASFSADLYALAMLTLDACGELGSKRQLPNEQLIPAVLSRGAYTVFVNETNIPDHLVDFFRGSLLEPVDDRWTIEQLMLYVSGKRFNLIPPNPLRDCPRPFDFGGQDHYALMHLAYSFSLDWDNALPAIRDNKFLKWIESMSYQSETQDKIEKLTTRAARAASKSGQADDVIARTISTLDPQGPIRYKNISIHPINLPQLFCEYIKEGDIHSITMLRELIAIEIISYWRDLKNSNYSKVPWDPQAINHLMRYSSLGFGTERIMYEMNPQLPCMSRDYLPYYAMNAKVMLLILNQLAKQQAEEKSLVDRHLIAFIAARCGIRKEIKVKDFQTYPALYENKEFNAIVILARAQEKTKVGPLHGLCCWAGMRLIEMIEHFHSREVRNRYSEDIRRTLPHGKLSYLVRVLSNKEYIQQDSQGFLRAKAMYHKNQAKISRLKNKKRIWRRSMDSGLRIAFVIGLMILFGVCYYLLYKYTH